jgi:hypothetical protein
MRRAGLGGALIAAALAGCTITSVDNSTGSGGGSSTSVTADATTTTSSGDGGGGEGGAGGGGAGGSGGGETCAGDEGTGKTVAECDDMNITPASHGGGAASICNPEGGTDGAEDPWGYGACLQAFAVYTAGSAEVMLACLSQISVAPADACDIEQVVACVDEVYAKACDSQRAAGACQAFKDLCGDDPFDLAGCTEDLKPFSDAGVQVWADCLNENPSDPCQQVHDDCFAKANGG